jgi:septum site-determining protein MinD
MAKSYSLISGKGGTGKTSSVINLAAALNSLGEDVLIVDAIISTPNIGIHLGAPIVPVTLNHILSDKADITEAIYKHDSGLKILPSSLSTQDLSKVKTENLAGLVNKLKKFSHYIILDSAAGLGKETSDSILASDEAIIVTQPEMPAVTDALKAIKLCEQLNKPVKGVIITRHRWKKSEMDAETILDMLEVPLIGIIPEDKNMQKALSLKSPIVNSHPKSKASKAYMETARRIMGLPEEKSFFSRIFGD